MTNIILDYRKVSIGLKKGDEDILLTSDVSIQVKTRELFSLVGESGSGKGISSFAIFDMFPQPGGYLKNGEIYFEGVDLLKITEQEKSKIRGNEISMIFQEPGSALNPLMKVKKQLAEVFSYHSFDGNVNTGIYEVMGKVGFTDVERILNAYPHELSGGMQQRVMIAMAILLKPKLLIADEPTTALDVTIQAQVMDLLLEIQEEMGMSIIFISHNLALVSQYADHMAIMCKGEIVETHDMKNDLSGLKHSYSRQLIEAVPKL
ncbi:MAG: ABC transporter ATP-binding protein [Flavobacteriales bacterium]|nr:ABC transporter ATP-binding protein [Flavobacteriales bacterium]